MRTVLNTALLLLAFAVGQADAAELTAAQAQQILSAAARATPGGDGVEVKLMIDNVEVAFTVKRDSVGNIIARPVVISEAAKVSIAQASIGTTVSATGELAPYSLVQINTDHSIITSNFTLNADGTIASLYRPGQAPGTQAQGIALTSTNAIQQPPGSGGGAGGSSFSFTVILPAGTSPGQNAPASKATP